MKKYLFIGVGIVASIIILFMGACYQKDMSGKIGDLSTQVMIQTGSESTKNTDQEDTGDIASEVEAVSQVENMYFTKEKVALSDMFLKNHSVFSKTPLNSASFKTLFAYHKERDEEPIITEISRAGESDFYYSIYEFPHITYISIRLGEPELDLDSRPWSVVLTDGFYQLTSSLKVGYSKEQLLDIYTLPTYYSGDVNIGATDWRVLKCINWAKDTPSTAYAIGFTGELTQEDRVTFNLPEDSILMNGLMFLLDEKDNIIAIATTIPGAG